ncbi:hypothetical protein [Arthrobacter sp. H14]|uniref:hypothetical protein n=1 Tax=Arthrobacter sp. H14 TaxID=1312959 RepID=UPI0004ADAB41|nr:hypothetical protein [Arthrobacter sp. H14]
MARLTTVSRKPLQLGLIAGAVGTVALNVVTYADMAIRARPPSSMPVEAAGKLAEKIGMPLGNEENSTHHKKGLGALPGFVTGLGTGAAYGLLRSRKDLPLPVAVLGSSVAAMAGSGVPMTALGLTDPRKWPASSWAMDIVPHLAYGAAAAAAYEVITR